MAAELVLQGLGLAFHVVVVVFVELLAGFGGRPPGLLGPLLDAGEDAVLGPPVAHVDEAVVAGQRIDDVQHEGHVVQVEVDALFQAAGFLADLQEGRREDVDVGHQHRVDRRVLAPDLRGQHVGPRLPLVRCAAD